MKKHYEIFLIRNGNYCETNEVLDVVSDVQLDDIERHVKAFLHDTRWNAVDTSIHIDEIQRIIA